MLHDVLSPGLAVIFCGTAAGNRSWEAGAYYAGRGNRFWKTLAAVGLTPRVLLPKEHRLLLEWGIGLTDLCKGAHGLDSNLVRADFDTESFWRTVGQHLPRNVAFNGKRAARQALGVESVSYGRLPNLREGAQLWVLPSTSRAASRFWDERPWRELSMAVQS